MDRTIVESWLMECSEVARDWGKLPVRWPLQGHSPLRISNNAYYVSSSREIVVAHRDTASPPNCNQHVIFIPTQIVYNSFHPVEVDYEIILIYLQYFFFKFSFPLIFFCSCRFCEMKCQKLSNFYSNWNAFVLYWFDRLCLSDWMITNSQMFSEFCEKLSILL